MVTVDLGFADISSSAGDHADVIAAIQAAVAINPDVTFDPVTGTMTYTSPGDGSSMTDILINLQLTEDGLIETPEAFSIALTNAGSPTGASVLVNADAGSISSLVIDASAADSESEWSITGPTETPEDETPQYTVALSGVFGEGESVSVELSFGHISTDNNDFTEVLSALQAAVDANPDLTFSLLSNAVNDASSVIQNDGQPFNDETPGGTPADSGNNAPVGILTYTSPSDGSSMADLNIDIPVFDDSIIENPELFFLALGNAESSGLSIGIDPERELVETLIIDNDFHVDSEPPVGAALPSPGRDVVASESTPKQSILEIAQLSFKRTTAILSEGIILETVNRISSLGSMFGSSGLSIPWIDALQKDSDPLEHSVLNTRYNEENSTGYSSGVGYRGTHSVDPTDECGRFFIDTIVRGEQLSIIARSTIDPQLSPGVTGYTATLADGQLIEISDGEYLVDVSVQTEKINLKIIAHRENGDDLTRVVVIDIATGEITEPGAQIDQATEQQDQ